MQGVFITINCLVHDRNSKTVKARLLLLVLLFYCWLIMSSLTHMVKTGYLHDFAQILSFYLLSNKNHVNLEHLLFNQICLCTDYEEINLL